MLVLCGIAVVVLGFALAVNPMLVVTVAALVTGLAAGMTPLDLLGRLGHAFTDARYIALIWLVLPLVGLVERAGLRERAAALVGRLHGATVGRVLLGYFVVRQVSAALGLTSLGGPVSMVRPVVAPMAQAALARTMGLPPAEIPADVQNTVRAHAGAADTIALFFGEDVFIAVGSILLILGFLEPYGITLTPLSVALWAAPTALAALLIHGARLLLLDRRLRVAGRRRGVVD